MDFTWLALAGLAVVCFVAYYFLARNPGNVQTPEDLKKLDKNPQFNMEKKTEQIGRQVAHFQAQQQKITVIDELQNVGTRLQEAEQQKAILHQEIVNAHDASVTAHKLTEHLSAVAKSRNVSLPALDVVRQEEEKSQTELERARELSKIRIQEAKALEENRLHGYKRETYIDLEAITKHRLGAHDTVLGVSSRLQELIVERENIQRLNVSDETRQALTKTQDELIEAFRKNLDVQIQRHLLEAGNKEDMGAAKEDSEGG